MGTAPTVPGQLGVWLSHDPADFGIQAARPVPGRPSIVDGVMRTGCSEAWRTERGIALYGNDAAREEAVEDLLKRCDRALAKLPVQQQ